MIGGSIFDIVTSVCSDSGRGEEKIHSDGRTHPGRGAFINDVSSEGEGGCTQISDAIREVA